MTIYGMLHPRADVRRLYLLRRSGVRGLIGLEDSVREVIGLAYYVQSSTEPHLNGAEHEGVLRKEHAKDSKQIRRRKRQWKLKKWKAKPLHGQLLHRIDKIKDDRSWDWMKKEDLKKGDLKIRH